MKKLILISLTTMTCIAITSCNNQKTMNNPLLKPFDTPYEVPPFNKITTNDFLPAIQACIEKHNLEIDSIVKNTDSPTFNNTILAFDKSGEDLARVAAIFNCLHENNTNDTIQQLADTIMPLLSQHGDAIILNEKLFAKIKQVYDKRNESNLDKDQIRVVEKYYEDFVRDGANLDSTKKEELKQINSQLSSLFLKFSNNLLAETNSFKLYIDNKNDLAGLPDYVIEQAAEAAKADGNEGKWLFLAQKTSMIPFLQFSPNRELREKLYRGYFMRGDNNNKNDNKQIIEDITNLRARKAHLLGFDSFGQYQISKNMAKNADTVYNFILKIYNPALKVAKNEVAEMQKIIDKEGGNFKLASWDWWYYSEKVRKAKFDLNEDALKPYFSLENVRNGMFMLANKLYGVKFEKVTNITAYLPEVEVYKATENNGDVIGLLYMDYYPRPSKGQGAWCSDLRQGGMDKNGKHILPIMTVTYNITKPAGNSPTLLNLDETETMFHEFGHALQGLFSYNKYSRICGDLPRDMVELPSQIMENWCTEPEMLRLYAKHYKTNEVIPDSLIQKIVKSSTFNTGFNTTELLAATLLDLKWNTKKEESTENVDEYESNYLKEINLIGEILPRYRSTYFSHIFSDDSYAAGYYVYTWAEVLDKDAFNAFKKSGNIFNPELAAKFRNYILTNCGETDPMIQYENFRGKKPSIEPYMKARGLR